MTAVELTCLEAWREISEMVDGTLEPGMRARMEVHLRNCGHCRAVFEGTRNVVHLLGEDGVDEIFDLPAGLSERLFQRLSVEFCGG